MSQPTRFLIAHPVCKRVAQLGARGDLQLGKYSIKVATDRSWRQEEAFRDLAVHQAGGDEVEDLHLSRGEAVDSAGPRQSEPLAAV